MNYEEQSYFAADCQYEMSKDDCESHQCVWTGGSRIAEKASLGCDGALFATIRNGSTSGAMRGYHQAMDSDDMWAVVTYLRELPGKASRRTD